MKRGIQESTTANVKAILNHLVTEKATYYKDKADSTQSTHSLKVDQLYNLKYHLTKQTVNSAVPGSMTPSKITMDGSD